MKIDQLDHVVLTVADIDATRTWYARALGMEARSFGDGRWALHVGRQKINLHLRGHEFEPKAAQPVPGSADLCFTTAATIEAIVQHLAEQAIPIIAGPVRRTGAQGAINSVYVRDPDQNLIEIATYHGA